MTMTTAEYEKRGLHLPPDQRTPEHLAALQPPEVPRMEKLASRLKGLAITFTVIGVITSFIGLALVGESAGRGLDGAVGTPMMFGGLASIIPFWILYGFAWALADFHVTNK